MYIRTWWGQLTPASRCAGCWSRGSEPPCWSSRWGVCATAGWDWGPCRPPPLPPAHTGCRGAAGTQQCSKTTSHSGPGGDEGAKQPTDRKYCQETRKVKKKCPCVSRCVSYLPLHKVRFYNTTAVYIARCPSTLYGEQSVANMRNISFSSVCLCWAGVNK